MISDIIHIIFLYQIEKYNILTNKAFDNSDTKHGNMIIFDSVSLIKCFRNSTSLVMIGTGHCITSNSDWDCSGVLLWIFLSDIPVDVVSDNDDDDVVVVVAVVNVFTSEDVDEISDIFSFVTIWSLDNKCARHLSTTSSKFVQFGFLNNNNIIEVMIRVLDYLLIYTFYIKLTNYFIK